MKDLTIYLLSCTAALVAAVSVGAVLTATAAPQPLDAEPAAVVQDDTRALATMNIPF